MKARLIGMLLVLCCGFIVVGGCAKKETVKPDETMSQSDKGKDTKAPEAVQEQPVVKETGSAEQAAAIQPFETIYFDFDSYVLRQDARDLLNKNAQWMQKNTAAKVQLEGHCDERGSDEYNLALGEKRAKAAFNYLKSLGISASRLSAISYGKEKPADQGHDEAAWAKNRRVEFVLVR
jgi:peptidoglycan-associated lipoprotein